MRNRLLPLWHPQWQCTDNAGAEGFPLHKQQRVDHVTLSSRMDSRNQKWSMGESDGDCSSGQNQNAQRASSRVRNDQEILDGWSSVKAKLCKEGEAVATVSDRDCAGRVKVDDSTKSTSSFGFGDIKKIRRMPYLLY